MPCFVVLTRRYPIILFTCYANLIGRSGLCNELYHHAIVIARFRATKVSGNCADFGLAQIVDIGKVAPKPTSFCMVTARIKQNKAPPNKNINTGATGAPALSSD